MAILNTSKFYMYFNGKLLPSPYPATLTVNLTSILQNDRKECGNDFADLFLVNLGVSVLRHKKTSSGGDHPLGKRRVNNLQLLHLIRFEAVVPVFLGGQFVNPRLTKLFFVTRLTKVGRCNPLPRFS